MVNIKDRINSDLDKTEIIIQYSDNYVMNRIIMVKNGIIKYFGPWRDTRLNDISVKKKGDIEDF